MCSSDLVTEEKLLLHAAAGRTLGPGLPCILPVWTKKACFDVVRQVGGDDDLDELAAKVRIEDGENDLHPAVQVAGHEIGAAEKDEGIAAVGEDVDAAVLEEAVDDAADADGFAEAGNSRTETADAADDHVEGDAFL